MTAPEIAFGKRPVFGTELFAVVIPSFLGDSASPAPARSVWWHLRTLNQDPQERNTHHAQSATRLMASGQNTLLGAAPAGVCF